MPDPRAEASDSKRASPPLESIQRWFQAVVVHPAGVAEAIRSVEVRKAIDVAAAELVVAPSSRQTGDERLSVYAEAYWARLIDCLREEFPAVRRVVGDEAFDQFAVGYLHAHPPTSYTLGRLSDRFPAYLAGNAPTDDAWSALIVDLAILERAIGDVFDLPGGETLGFLQAGDLEAVPVERRGDVRLEALPTLRLLEFHSDVDDYFTAARGGRVPDGLPPCRPTYLALSRREYVVRRHALSAAQYRLLAAIVAGRTLAEALTSLAEADVDLPGRGELAESAAEWFRLWARAGFFRRCDWSP